jgi:hypothetical protein
MVLEVLTAVNIKITSLMGCGTSQDQQGTAPTTTRQTAPDYQRMFRMRLEYRLHTEMHYSLWANGMDTFRGYWLHGNIYDGKMILTDQI